MSGRIVVLMFTLAILFGGSAEPGEQTGRPSIKESDCSNIRATVFDVQRLEFPRARLHLRVTESSNPRVLELKGGARIIAAENYLWQVGGKIDWSDRRNGGSVIAYYLLPGDEIRAKLISGAAVGSGAAEWYVFEIVRMGREGVPDRSVTRQGDLQLVLEVDREVYRTGEPVRIALSVTNTGRSEKTLAFSSGQKYDFAVAQSGREVWRWSRDKLFTQALTSLKLKPGETKRFEETWRQVDNRGRRVSAGEYAITGTLTTMGRSRPTIGPVTIRTL